MRRVPHPWQLLPFFFLSLQSNVIFWFSGAVFTADGADCRRHQTESNEGQRLFTLSMLKPGNYFRKASWILVHGEVHYVSCKLSKQITSSISFHIHKKPFTTTMLLTGIEQRYRNVSVLTGSFVIGSVVI